MKKRPTPEQLEAIRKKYANKGYDDYGMDKLKIVKANPQPPEGSKEHGEESA